MSQKKRKNYLQMDKIIKRLFTLKNKKPIIDFLNAVYGDNISYDAKFDYGDNEINNIDKIKYVTFRADMYISVKDKDRRYQYALEFQTIFENDMAIRIFRYSFERAVKLNENIENKNHIKITLPKPYLIVLEEEKDLGDKLKLEIEIENGESFFYNIDVLRYWTYDLDKLYSENLYLLYPLQLFRIRKSMQDISNSKNSYEYKKEKMLLIYEELIRIIEKTLKAIDKAYNEGKIKINDYNEMNVVIENLNSYFGDMYGKYGDIDEEVNKMVKTFYDPNVEKKGIEKGMEQGIKKSIENQRLKDIERVKKLLTKKFGIIDDKLGLKIEKADIEVLGVIIENILDVETIEEVEKLLK